MDWPFGASLHFEIGTFKDRVLKILFYTLSREVATLLYAYLWVLPTRVGKSEHGIHFILPADSAT